MYNVGDIIILKWIGISTVPKYLNGTKAEIIGVTKRGIKVKSLENDLILSINPDKNIYKDGIIYKNWLE